MLESDMQRQTHPPSPTKVSNFCVPKDAQYYVTCAEKIPYFLFTFLFDKIFILGFWDLEIFANPITSWLGGFDPKVSGTRMCPGTSQFMAGQKKNCSDFDRD